MRRWTGRWTLGGLPVVRMAGDWSCHAAAAQRKGLAATIQDCQRGREVRMCEHHMAMLYRAGHLRPELVEAEEGDRVVGRCTGELQDGARCGRAAGAIYPATPRCPAHDEQLPTRWDIEAEDETPPIQTRWDEEDRQMARRAAAAAEAEAAAAARWDELRECGRVVVAEAHARLEAEQGRLLVFDIGD